MKSFCENKKSSKKLRTPPDTEGETGSLPGAVPDELGLSIDRGGRYEF